MIKKEDKRAQEIFGMSFGMIFTIILIAFFIVIAIIAISSFKRVQECAKIGIFSDRLKTEVNRAWNSNDQSFEFSGELPSKIKKICFANITERFYGKDNSITELKDYDLDMNLFLYPLDKACDIPAHKIAHLNLEKMIKNANPFCIDISNGKVEIMIEKQSDERLVTISEAE